MATGITERDKKLLYMLGIIVIAALFFIIGIRPVNRKIKELNKEISSAQETYDAIKMKMYQLGTIQAFKENAETMAQDLSSRYYEMMVPAEVDKLFTNKALGYGLKVNNLNIKSNTEPVTQLAYINSEAYRLHQQAMEAALLEVNDDSGSNDDSSSKDDSTDSSDVSSKISLSGGEMVDVDTLASINNDSGIYSVADTTAADVYATNMVLDVYGSRDKAQALLDELIKNPSLRVTSYQWTQMTTVPYQYVDGQLVHIDQEQSDRLIINFDMYMYNGKQFKEMAEEELKENESTGDSEQSSDNTESDSEASSEE